MKELTAKAKEAFEDTYTSTVIPRGFGRMDDEIVGLDDFYQLPECMQWGVLVDFFITEKITVSVDPNAQGWVIMNKIADHKAGDLFTHSYKSLPEARRAAIEKATQIFNER